MGGVSVSELMDARCTGAVHVGQALVHKMMCLCVAWKIGNSSTALCVTTIRLRNTAVYGFTGIG